MHNYPTYSVFKFYRTALPTDPPCFPKHFFSPKLLLFHSIGIFFPISFSKEQIVPETSLTDCPIACPIPQELFSVENLLKIYAIRPTKCCSSQFFSVKQCDTSVFPLFQGIHILGKQAEGINYISMHLCVGCTQRCHAAVIPAQQTFADNRRQLKGTTRKCD